MGWPIRRAHGSKSGDTCLSESHRQKSKTCKTPFAPEQNWLRIGGSWQHASNIHKQLHISEQSSKCKQQLVCAYLCIAPGVSERARTRRSSLLLGLPLAPIPTRTKGGRDGSLVHHQSRLRSPQRSLYPRDAFYSCNINKEKACRKLANVNTDPESLIWPTARRDAFDYHQCCCIFDFDWIFCNSIRFVIFRTIGVGRICIKGPCGSVFLSLGSSLSTACYFIHRCCETRGVLIRFDWILPTNMSAVPGLLPTAFFFSGLTMGGIAQCRNQADPLASTATKDARQTWHHVHGPRRCPRGRQTRA